MQVKIAAGMRFGDLGRINIGQRIIGDHRTADMVEQTGIGIARIGIFIDPPILAVDVAGDQFLDIHHQLLVIAQFVVLGAIKDVKFGRFGQAAFDKRRLHLVLNDRDIRHFAFTESLVGQFKQNILADRLRQFVIGGAGRFQRLAGRQSNALRIEIDNPAVPFTNFRQLQQMLRHFPPLPE
mgnify:CR=1 FL=1